MAGQKIIRAYRAKVEQAGGVWMVLDRIAQGEKISEIAHSVGVSPAFMSMYLFRFIPGARSAVWLARCKAAYAAAAQAHTQAIHQGRKDERAFHWIQSRGGMPKQFLEVETVPALAQLGIMAKRRG